jgi:uncharacterized membrane-anchored protein
MWSTVKIKAAIFSRHLGQSTVACLTAMTQGDFSTVTLKHWTVALMTGVIAGVFAVLVSFTPLFRRYNPIVSFAMISFLGTLIADRLAHPSGFGGPWTEALATALGAAAISVVISLAPVAAAVERMEHPDFHKPPR